MIQRRIILAIVVFFVADTTYSFLQHYSYDIDGDLPKIVLPRQDYAPVLQNPFGYDAVVKGKTYKGTNRFFCHWSMAEYYRSAPFWFQGIASPIESIYLSTATFKTIVQVALIFAIAYLAIPKGRLFSGQFWLAVLVITPFFQTADRFSKHLRIIDQAATYAFFYALPLCVLLVFLIPFKKGIETASPIVLSMLLALMVFIAFSGPLMGPTVLLGGAALLFFYWVDQGHQKGPSGLISFTRANPKYLFLLAVFGALSIYSFYLGTLNWESIHQSSATALSDRYARLPVGIWRVLTEKYMYALLVAAVIINFIYIRRRFRSGEGARINLILGFILVFSAIYVMLLPFGGYRPYREFIVRWDTVMPITIALLYYLARSSVFIFSNTGMSWRSKYVIGLGAILVLLTLGDVPNFHRNKAEKASLRILADSNDEITVLEGDHSVLSWSKTTDYRESRVQAETLYMWGVTDGVRLFEQR